MTTRSSLRGKKMREKGFLVGCVLPALILFCVFTVYPTIQVFRTSFFNWSGLGEQRFIGFENYQQLIKDAKFWLAFRNTLILMIVVTVITMAFALFFAAIISRAKIREANFYRIVLFFPNVLSIVVIGILFRNLFDPRSGIVNAVLRLFMGADATLPTWLGDKNLALWVVAIAMVWQAVGYYMVMYIAGMDGISPELYEVADLEGANQIQQFFKITLPMIWSVVRVTMVFFIISTLNMSFQFVKIMTDGGPDGSSEVLLTYMNTQAFGNSSFGYAMAVAVFIFIFSFVLSLISNKLSALKDDV